MSANTDTHNSEVGSNKEDYSQDDSEVSEPDEERKQREAIRNNLSTLSFEELIKLKEKVGSKVYNETVYGVSRSKKEKDHKELKRANKNRPREISSKIKPRQIIAILSNNHGLSLPKAKLHSPRDPRFDSSCGEFDKTIFKQNYQFVNDLRQEEKDKLQNEYQECSDADRKKTIKMLIQRIENQVREEEKTNKEKQKEDSEKKEIRARIKQGEKPEYKKKSVKRLENLVEKYEELKKTNRLQKHIQKRAKKLKVKDRKIMQKIK